MGILANHVPSVEALRPGLLEIIESSGSSKKWFGASGSGGGEPCAAGQDLTEGGRAAHTVSAGFATVHPNNSLTVNAVEAYELESFSPEVRVGDCRHRIHTHSSP